MSLVERRQQLLQEQQLANQQQAATTRQQEIQAAEELDKKLTPFRQEVVAQIKREPVYQQARVFAGDLRIVALLEQVWKLWYAKNPFKFVLFSMSAETYVNSPLILERAKKYLTEQSVDKRAQISRDTANDYFERSNRALLQFHINADGRSLSIYFKVEGAGVGRKLKVKVNDSTVLDATYENLFDLVATNYKDGLSADPYDQMPSRHATDDHVTR